MINDEVKNIMQSHAAISEILKPAIGNSAITAALKPFSYVSGILQSMQAIQPAYIQGMRNLMGLAEEPSSLFPSIKLQSSFISCLGAMSKNSKPLVSDRWFSTAAHLQSVMSLVNKVITPGITSELYSLANYNIGAMSMTGFGLDDITYVDNKLIFDGIEYGEEELIAECRKEIEELKRENPVESFKKKHWLICLVFSLIFLIPEVGQITEFSKDIPHHIEQFIKTNILGEKTNLNVIKENAFIRDEANSKSRIIVEVTYAEKLEVIEDVPYWYKVKYISDGKEYIGWISKISIGTEDSINE